MIAMYAFAATFVFLAVGTLLFALLKGRPARTGPVTPRNRNFTIFWVVLTFGVIGLAIPALTIADSRNNDIVHAEGIRLTANEKKGQALFGELCAGCHRLASANAQGRTGPNLDVLMAPLPVADAAAAKKSYSTRYGFVFSTILNGKDAGQGNMPALIAQGQQAKDIAAFVAATAGYANP